MLFMPSFWTGYRKKPLFSFARTVFSLVVGFLCWAGLLLLLDLYDAYAPIREADASFWIYWVAGMAALLFWFAAVLLDPQTQFIKPGSQSGE